MLGSSESFIRSEDVHWRDFLKYNQDILLLHTVPLYTMFKALACQSLYSVLNKIDFVLSWPKCSLNLLSTNQSHKHKKSLSSCFSIYYQQISHTNMKNLLVVAFQFQLHFMLENYASIICIK